jgi:hypothetical protein
MFVRAEPVEARTAAHEMAHLKSELVLFAVLLVILFGVLFGVVFVVLPPQQPPQLQRREACGRRFLGGRFCSSLALGIETFPGGFAGFSFLVGSFGLRLFPLPGPEVPIHRTIRGRLRGDWAAERHAE